MNDGEMQLYVNAFARSSDRTRYALFTVIVVSVLIAIANWNAQLWSWPKHRLDRWYSPEVFAALHNPTAAGESDHRFLIDSLQIVTAREEYVKQFTSNTFFTSSPIPGVSIDINDLGTLGGSALVLLMTVLVFCLSREHENLFLSLYKVRELRISDPRGSEPRSEANLLYHSLAMSQVLSSPPTLARWESRGPMRSIQTGGYLVLFYAPWLVLFWVYLTNMRTAKVGASYGADIDTLIWVQRGLSVCLFILSSLAFAYSNAMSERWRWAFYRINPGREKLSQMPLRRWLRLKVPYWKRDPLKGILDARLSNSVDFRAEDEPQEFEFSCKVELSQPDHVGSTDVAKMRDAIIKKGKALSQADGAGSGRLLDVHIDSNQVLRDAWNVQVKWRVLCRSGATEMSPSLQDLAPALGPATAQTKLPDGTGLFPPNTAPISASPDAPNGGAPDDE